MSCRVYPSRPVSLMSEDPRLARATANFRSGRGRRGASSVLAGQVHPLPVRHTSAPLLQRDALSPRMPLHAHDPHSLLPLLRAQLPHSVVMLATLLSNPPTMLGAVYATFPPAPDGRDVTPAYLASAGVGEFDWLVAAALPEPSEQIRLHHALVGAPEAVQAAKRPEASGVVGAAVADMFRLYPQRTTVGAAPELFGPAVRAALGAPRRTPTYVFAAPGCGMGPSDIDATDDTAGLTLDVGRPEDAPEVSPARLV